VISRSAGEFSDFFRDSFHQTLGLVALSVGSPAVAEDATQEAFARALTRWDSVSRMNRPDRWVLKVAMNLAVDHHRKHARHDELDAEQPERVPDQVEQLWIRWQLEQLTPMQRRAVLLHYFDGLAIEEVAEALRRSKETIRTHLRLARERLRAQLAKEPLA
jgi:RNA polymerase sigma-70 factor (ECF subfamily)